MRAAVLLIVQFVLGIGVNLIHHAAETQILLGNGFGSATLAAHAIVALLLLGASIGALVRAIRSRRVIVLTSAGLAAVLAAGIVGYPSWAIRATAPHSAWPWPPPSPCSATWSRSSDSADPCR